MLLEILSRSLVSAQTRRRGVIGQPPRAQPQRVHDQSLLNNSDQKADKPGEGTKRTRVNLGLGYDSRPFEFSGGLDRSAQRTLHCLLGVTSQRSGIREHRRSMSQVLGLVSVVVRDYDEALSFYVGVLDFDLVEDTPIPEQSKRWVVVRPPGAHFGGILLARAANEEQASRVGNQTGGRVFLFLYTSFGRFAEASDAASQAHDSPSLASRAACMRR